MNNDQTSCIALAVLFLLFLSAHGQKLIVVPQTKFTDLIITDGRFANEEWRDATIVPINQTDSVYLYLINQSNHIVLGVKSPFRRLAYIDMFIDFGTGEIHHFHSSAQIGERILTDTLWTDQDPPMHWGNNKQWYANEMRTDRIKAQELLKDDPNRDRSLMLLETTYPFDGYEYIFSKKRFSNKNWRIRIEVRSGMPGSHDLIFPAKSTRKNSANWAALHFN